MIINRYNNTKLFSQLLALLFLIKDLNLSIGSLNNFDICDINFYLSDFFELFSEFNGTKFLKPNF